MKDFGISESPKSTRSSTTHWCPGRPGHPAFRHNIASSLQLHTGLPYDWTPRSDAPLGSPLAPSARRVSRVASRLPGTIRLRFALHGGQRTHRTGILHHRPHPGTGRPRAVAGPQPGALEHREPPPLGPRCHVRRGALSYPSRATSSDQIITRRIGWRRHCCSNALRILRSPIPTPRIAVSGNSSNQVSQSLLPGSGCHAYSTPT